MAKYRKKDVEVATTFVPKFWDDLDQRCAIVKEIRRRYHALKTDTGANSVQKEILLQRAIFVNIQLETMECTAAGGGSIDMGSYTQMLNTLKGLLKDLGLEKTVPKTVDLKAYVGGKR